MDLESKSQAQTKELIGTEIGDDETESKKSEKEALAVQSKRDDDDHDANARKGESIKIDLNG
jgi:hypothetical protein